MLSRSFLYRGIFSFLGPKFFFRISPSPGGRDPEGAGSGTDSSEVSHFFTSSDYLEHLIWSADPDSTAKETHPIGHRNTPYFCNIASPSKENLRLQIFHPLNHNHKSKKNTKTLWMIKQLIFLIYIFSSFFFSLKNRRSFPFFPQFYPTFLFIDLGSLSKAPPKLPPVGLWI